MTTALHHRVRSFCLALALAVVLTCALGSFGSPVRASTGSAFNAFTSDVSLGPTRAGEPEKQRKVQAVAPGGAGHAGATLPLQIGLSPRLRVAAAAHFLPSFAPPASIVAGALGARGPPLR